MTRQCKICSKPISWQQARRNAGLCKACMTKALEYTAEQLLKRKKKDEDK
jgi:hypothetical protein